VAAGCGWRGGAIFGLELDALDLDRREAHVRHQLSVITGRSPHLAPPKTTTSARTNELPTIVSDALRAHLATFPVRPEYIRGRDRPAPACGSARAGLWFGPRSWSSGGATAGRSTGELVTDLAAGGESGGVAARLRSA
jgi:hypothetical protein